MPLKAGQLAKRTGLTIRTLHYYEEVGLLVPSERTEAGHRLYGTQEVVQLQRIVSLRQLGFSLDEIQTCLDQPAFSLENTIQRHLVHIEKQIKAQQQLYRRLERIASQLASSQTVTVEDFFQTINMITMYEKYYTQEQLAELAERREQLGEEKIQHVQTEWADLIAQIRTEMENGTDPSGETPWPAVEEPD